ncbi:hypothetical protein COY15_04310 [Candidatus Roizmanbacteria bacterium CG_4_10_14_0_2_um_filter_39_12]|nr:MAG: hypothetical protein COY15_04310 [Candidatus Roizmanbacteria bacterium CG_4_10_14_0_2_um_filter_39_12]
MKIYSENVPEKSLKTSMNTQKIIEKLHQLYPEKKVVLNPSENPTEIICELDPTSAHPEKSIALAIVGSSKPHYHQFSTEIYETQKGILTVYVSGKKRILQEGEKITIEPNCVHYVTGEDAWFLIYSEPGWTFEDHIVVEEYSFNSY